jgi:hypothetical protein
MLMFKINRNTIKSTLDSIKKQLPNFPVDVYNKFVSVTPKDTGNARRRTRLVARRYIKADYKYAGRLDRGYSRQAPQGMIKPTKQWARTRLQQILRKR